MRRILTRTTLAVSLAAFIALAGLGAWHYTRPDPVVRPGETLHEGLAPATYRLVRALEERVVLAEDAPTLTLLGQAYVQAARETSDGAYNDRAERAFRRALALDPDDHAAMSGLGLVFLTRHRFDEALAWGRRALAQNPRHTAGHGVVVDALVELGRYDEAVAVAQQMVDARPDQASFTRVSYLRELHGDVAGAVDAMARAVTAGSASAENTAWCRVYLGHLHFHAGALEQAEAAYRMALVQLPGYGHAHAGLGRVALARGDVAGATAHYEAAVAVAPIPEYTAALGEVYRAAGRTAEADRQRDATIAALEAERAGGMDVDDELAALLLDDGRDPRRALALARAAHDRRPTIRNAALLARALHAAGDARGALPLARQALRLGTADASLYYQAGLIARDAGETALGARYLRRALQINPHFSADEAAHAQALLALR